MPSQHITSSGTAGLANTGACNLVAVNINTAAATRTLTVYDGVDAGGVVIGVYDLATIGPFFLSRYCYTGIFTVCSGGAPDVTIVFE